MGIFIPEAIEELKSVVLALQKAGMNAMAIVIEDQESRGLAKHQHEELLQGSGVKYSFHDNIGSAESWLKAQRLIQ